MSKFKDYWKSIEVSKRDAFAERCGTTANHLNNIAYGNRDANETLSVRLERESKGAVTVADMRPLFADDLASAGYRNKRKAA